MKKLSIRIFASILTFFLWSGIAAQVPPNYFETIQQWRSDRQARLIKEDGWLSVAGLFWLKDGVNSVGSGKSYDVGLTDSFTQGRFGEIVFLNGKATLKVDPGIPATSGKTTISTIDLGSEAARGAPASVSVGSQTFYLIRRGARSAIRLKDSNRPERLEFTGLNWFPIDPELRITADFEPYSEPRLVKVSNIIGETVEMKSPGVLKFKIRGTEYRLTPVAEGDQLFIIFRDLTSRTTTYGAPVAFFMHNAPRMER